MHDNVSPSAAACPNIQPADHYGVHARHAGRRPCGLQVAAWRGDLEAHEAEGIARLDGAPACAQIGGARPAGSGAGRPPGRTSPTRLRAPSPEMPLVSLVHQLCDLALEQLTVTQLSSWLIRTALLR